MRKREMSIAKKGAGMIGEAGLKGLAAVAETLSVDLHKGQKADKGMIDRIDESKRQAAELAKRESIEERLRALKTEKAHDAPAFGDKQKTRERGFERLAPRSE